MSWELQCLKLGGMYNLSSEDSGHEDGEAFILLTLISSVVGSREGKRFGRGSDKGGQPSLNTNTKT